MNHKTRNNQLHARRYLSMALCAFALVNGACANEIYQLTLAAGVEDNVVRVAQNLSNADSPLLKAQFTLGKMFAPAINHTLVVSGDISNNRYIDLRGYDSTAVSATASYTYKMGLGAYAPRIGTAITMAYDNMRGEARDRRLLTTELTLEKRLSPAWLFFAGIDYQLSRGETPPRDNRLSSFGYDPNNTLPTDLYNDDAHSMFADLSYEMSNGYLVNVGYSRINGFVVSSTEIPTLKLYKIAKAITVDPAWSTLWFGYRIPADIDDWSVGLSMPVGQDSSLDFGANWQDISAPQNTGYRNRSVSISFVHNF